jgi:hypothetical protein
MTVTVNLKKLSVDTEMNICRRGFPMSSRRTRAVLGGRSH